MAVAKLPAAIAILRDGCKVSVILHAAAVEPNLSLVIRNTHRCEIGR